MKTIKTTYRLSSAAVRGSEVDHVSDTIWPLEKKKKLLNFRERKESLKTRFKRTRNRNGGFLMTAGECDQNEDVYKYRSRVE